jgi:DNA-binding PadR family transcriptional regulator
MTVDHDGAIRKIYAESFQGAEHLAQILREAQEIVNAARGGGVTEAARRYSQPPRKPARRSPATRAGQRRMMLHSSPVR